MLTQLMAASRCLLQACSKLLTGRQQPEHLKAFGIPECQQAVSETRIQADCATEPNPGEKPGDFSQLDMAQGPSGNTKLKT